MSNYIMKGGVYSMAKNKVRLLEFRNGNWEFVDYGVLSQIDTYCEQGYLVEYL